MRLVVTCLAVVGLGMLLGAASYESFVMAPNYAARAPESLEHARAFFVAANPGMFFRVLGPVTQALLVLALVSSWRAPAVRWWIVGALALLLVGDAVTFAFHYPRNDRMFVRPLAESSPAELQSAAHEWGRGNHLRVGLLAFATAAALAGLVRVGREGGR